MNLPSLPYRVTLLGRFEIRSRDTNDRGSDSSDSPAAISHVRTQKTAALLACLCCAPPRRQHPREELAARFWPDSSEEAARVSLRTALAALRRQLEPPGVTPGSVLITDRWHVSLNPDAFTVDAVAFEAAAQIALEGRGRTPAERFTARQTALDLYGGDFLPGSYEEWALDERERLRALYEQLLEEFPASTVEKPQGTAKPERDLEPASALPHLQSAAEAPPVRLPIFRSSFRGRQSEITRLMNGLIPDKSAENISLPERSLRLLTLMGPGGTGKTRLATETARRCAAATLSPFAPVFPGGVFFVPLADVSTGQSIPRAVASVLGIKISAGDDILSSVAKGISERTLLVLDNLEQLLDSGGSEAVFTLLERVPSAVILATSRRRLALPGEQVLPVEPLAVPDENEGDYTPESVAFLPSVQLFVDRAQEVRPDFQVTRTNAASIAALCRTLEGLPLALELVAARAHTLTPGRMVEQLSSGRWGLTADLRRSSRRTERHRSLQAAIAWSVELLPPELARFWSALSLFRGGCTSEAAAAVTGDSYALERLTQLRERSLVTLEDSGGQGEIRFRLLETLREFASEHIESVFAPEEQTELEERFLAFYFGFVRSIDLKRNQQAEALAQIAAEWSNIECAIDLFHALPDGILEESRTVAKLYDFFFLRGHLPQGRALGRRALQRPYHQPGDPLYLRMRSDLLNATGLLAVWEGDFDEAESMLEESAVLARHLGHAMGIANALNNLGVIAKRRKNYDLARKRYEEVMALCEAAGRNIGVAIAAHNIGTLEVTRGNGQAGILSLKRALELRIQEGLWSAAAESYASLGDAFLQSRNGPEAISHFREGLRLRRELQDDNGCAFILFGLAQLAVIVEDWIAAAQALGAASTARKAAGVDWDPETAKLWHSHGEQTREALGETEYACRFAEGLTCEDSALLVLRLEHPEP